MSRSKDETPIFFPPQVIVVLIIDKVLSLVFDPTSLMGRRIRFPDFQLLPIQASKVRSTHHPLAGNGVAKHFLEPWLPMTYSAVPAALLLGSSLTSDEY